jgi:hypothetical protein
VCRLGGPWSVREDSFGNRYRIISLSRIECMYVCTWHVHTCGGWCGAGSIDFWVPHPRGCGWCVHVPLFATHPFPSGASPILCNAQQKLPFLLPRRHHPQASAVFSLIFCPALPCYCRESYYSNPATEVLIAGRSVEPSL